MSPTEENIWIDLIMRFLSDSVGFGGWCVTCQSNNLYCAACWGGGDWNLQQNGQVFADREINWRKVLTFKLPFRCLFVFFWSYANTLRIWLVNTLIKVDFIVWHTNEIPTIRQLSSLLPFRERSSAQLRWRKHPVLIPALPYRALRSKSFQKSAFQLHQAIQRNTLQVKQWLATVKLNICLMNWFLGGRTHWHANGSLNWTVSMV